MTKSFKELQAEWYKKLKDDGFEDIEDADYAKTDSIDRPLKKRTGLSLSVYDEDGELFDQLDSLVSQPPGPIISAFPESLFKAKENFANHSAFKECCESICKHKNSSLTPVEVAEIWYLHCDGQTMRKIAARFQVTEGTIHNTVRKLTEYMNLTDMRTDVEPTTNSVVVLRAYQSATDVAFLFSTWRNALFYDEKRPESEADKFYREANRDIKKILSDTNTLVKIACLQDDPDFIVGYAVLNRTNLEFVYVKIDYRKKSIATLLCKGFETLTAPKTKLGMIIAIQKQYKFKGEVNVEKE